MIRTYRLARRLWFKRWPVRYCPFAIIGDTGRVECPADSTHPEDFPYPWGIYRGRAWPRFWLAKVEVSDALPTDS